jgi:predicted AlkP superfamily phosphohydrolase/phosphomutase
MSINFEINMIPDITKSIAYMISNESCGIYLNSVDRFEDGIISKDQYEKVRHKIFNDLKKLKFNEEKLLKHVWLREDIYSGCLINNAPDILFLPNSHWPSSSLFPSILFDTKPINNHNLEGIFLIYGSDIKKGKNINAKIFDIVPTILHIFNLSIPNDMDGIVLTEIFEEKSDLAIRKSKYVDPEIYKNQQELKNLKTAIKNIKKKSK